MVNGNDDGNPKLPTFSYPEVQSKTRLELQTKTKISWWRRKSWAFRTWIFVSTIWIVCVFLYIQLFEPWGNSYGLVKEGVRRGMGDREYMQMYSLYGLPLLGGAILWAYNRLVK
ncbi:MAG: hypothetical protein A2218_07805 [Elusimicrobia bacterium RIFOXYA2_FULL_53_38]|nr:MAG: hypothetical protein A2218_07805 [Elusimicrobia bacterium RIFOXYA2_FULL_53_38]